MTELDYATQKLAEQKQRIRELEHLLDQATSHADECCAEVSRLKKEADWLAWKIIDVGGCRYCCSDCGIMTDPIKCFRDAARKAVGG